MQNAPLARRPSIGLPERALFARRRTPPLLLLLLPPFSGSLV